MITPAALKPTLSLALQLARRDLRNRYLGSFSGGAWALLQPLVQLAVYAFVFGYVFRQRLPGADAPGYVPFLVVAMWPWTAFAEALSRATTAIQDNASLLGKVALPRAALVLAPVLASFAIHGVGFIGLLLVMLVIGTGISPAGLLLMLPALALLFLFALGLALLLAALQVFVRDIAPALPQMLMLWMFLSPVFYGRYVMPEGVRSWFDFNPMTGFVEYLRFALLDMPMPGLRAVFCSVLAVALALAAGVFAFRRLQRHFEDFL
ncbi:ABC-2 type transport system permease protein/lipopolysaccharide transport system permease protein [Tahibacter aquaticus]|uniref:Transport permease protein n=1 Tax=Tahibacter aquaticus TaxID=520092 RepID=A0A4R6ZA07_9GAMM|nr:ABC transporter permease [Tahibacter aquaticus]TDR48767.1 ABC-2 type transport system permease protein/lipopolysaccharide transport system permease protein [Tahibacter aquaticus]